MRTIKYDTEIMYTYREWSTLQVITVAVYVRDLDICAYCMM